ncbi:MAG TPA: MarR family winged helix-turn-helix transcriptional regulator [Acidimicrobiales bacterium]|nr:MarR family winged helix-turn-helix transcriptional regulator [Acidimicrobiales bacterium]
MAFVGADGCEQHAEMPGDLSRDLGWLVSVLLRAYRAAASAATIGLPGGERGYAVLAVTSGADHGNQQAIGRRLGIDRTVMVHLVDELETAGLVERRPDPCDRRARRVVATPAGAAAKCSLASLLAAVEDEVLAPLDASERAELRRLLQMLATHHADRRGHPPASCTDVELGECPEP